VRSYLKMTLTGFALGSTMFAAALLFPRGWVKPKDEGGLAALLFLMALIAGIVSLISLVGTL